MVDRNQDGIDAFILSHANNGSFEVRDGAALTGLVDGAYKMVQIAGKGR
jgi:hypothetical protein